MKKIAPKDIDKNVIKLIGQDWMLVTAGDQEKFKYPIDPQLAVIMLNFS